MPTLNWIGKEKVITHHEHVPYRVLDHQYDYGTPSDEGKNMIIHGDNLEALKALLPQYEGVVDCIYIDPPYNTGNEKWVYNDNVNDPHIRKWLNKVVGTEAEDLTRNDKWLCMMYPRLVLLQKLLSPTGVIFISIDDNEQANLKLICDEIFGAGNFVSCFIWHKKTRPSNKLVNKELGISKGVSLNTEYILCYALDKSKVIFKTDELSVVNASAYKNPDNDPRGPWITDPLWAESNSNKKKILYLPDGTPLEKQWFVNQDTLDELFANDMIHIGKNTMRKKVFLADTNGQTLMNFLPATRYGTSESGTNEYKVIMGKANFTNPKPIELIEHLLTILYSNKDAIILDSFAGSGTTAHAVLNLNKQDGGHRRFILCEMCDYAETITAERVRRVIDGYGEGNKSVEGTGGSFSYYELGTTIFDPATGLLNNHADPEQIRNYVWYSETHTPYHPTENAHQYLLGQHDRTNYYFYYLPDQETCLDWTFLNTMTERDRAEMYIIYADRCLLTEQEMAQRHIRYKKIPRDIKRV